MFKHEGDSIFLNGFKIPLAQFKRLEPGYKSPNGLIVMFYDGVKRNYRTKDNSWTIPGSWADGDRYMERVDEFASLLKAAADEEAAVNKEVEEAVKNAVQNANNDSEPDVKAKYPVEEPTNVELQQRDDIKPKRIKRVRSTGKRSPRT
jgi:hypothetical protein